jgi:hypothetical protein
VFLAFPMRPFIIYNVFVILYRQVGPWPAVRRKPLNKYIYTVYIYINVSHCTSH